MRPWLVLALLSGPALAVAGPPERGPEVRAGVALGAVVTNPWLTRRYVALQTEAWLVERVGVGSVALLSPDLGQLDWKPSLDRLIDDHSVSPATLSRELGLVAGESRFKVASGTVLPVDVGLQLVVSVGGGFVHTVDDVDPTTTRNTTRQWHPTVNAGAELRVDLGRVALDARYRWFAYSETFGADERVFVRRGALELGTSVAFGRGRRAVSPPPASR